VSLISVRSLLAFRPAPRNRRGRRPVPSVLPTPVIPLVAVLCCVASCSSSKDPAKETKKEAEAFASWAATIHLLADGWLKGAAPNAYVGPTLRTVRETLRKQSEKLRSSSKIPTATRARLQESLTRLDRALGEMSGAVERGDSAAVARYAESVVSEEGALNAIAHAASGQPPSPRP
jgi:hypothetical protein